MASAMLSGLRWRKSSRSNSKGHCVEVAFAAQVVMTRDSKHRDGGVLAFPRETGQPSWKRSARTASTAEVPAELPADVRFRLSPATTQPRQTRHHRWSSR